MRRMLPHTLWLALLLAACSATQDPPELPPAAAEAVPVISQQAPVPIAAQMGRQTDIVTLKVTDRGLEPGLLVTAAGGKVKLHLLNAGTRVHNLVIPRFGIVSRALGPGEENYVEFTAGTVGEWPLYSDATPADSESLHGILKVE
ncbi:MAG: cupredoxin domain-containing protein [Mycobacterium leprae]